MTEQANDLAAILASLPATTAVALLPFLFGGSGGAGGSAGDGGAAGGGGGAAGGSGGSGGVVIYNVNYAPAVPPELMEWLLTVSADLSDALQSTDDEVRRSGWERFGHWLGGQALTVPANVVGGIIGTMLLQS